jgi:hypothetical protein
MHGGLATLNQLVIEDRDKIEQVTEGYSNIV